MKKLLSTVGGRIVLQENKDDYVHMIVEKISTSETQHK